MQQYQQ